MSTAQTIMGGDIDRLTALQELDRELKAKREQMEALVADAEDCEGKLSAERAALERLNAERRELEVRRADLEVRLEIEGGKIRDSRMRMNRVRTDREMLALQRQVELGREANQQVEEQVLAVMEEIETLATRCAEGEAAIRELEEKMQTEVAAWRERARVLAGELSAEKARRDTVAGAISPSLRSKYEQLFDRRGGSAVVEVRQGTCLGCHMNVPPQLYNEVQRYRDVRQCPNCHRIIFWRPESSDVGNSV